MKLALLALAAFASVASAQTTWYVDDSGLPPGNGTPASPYASIQYAHDRPTTLTGHTLVVAPGTYDERLTLTKRITVRSSGGPLVTALRPTTAGSVVKLNTAIDHFAELVLDGFTIHKLGGDANTCVQGTSGTLRRCIVLGNGLGLGVGTNYDLAVESCLITGHAAGMNSAYVNFVYPKNTIVVGNTLYDVDILNNDTSTYCCYGTGSFAATPGLVTADPQWFDALGHDFHLLAGSPCIDAGNPNSPLDPDGSHADIGPVAFDGTHVAFASYCTAKTNSLGCVPAISAVGTASATASTPFTITCTQELNHRPGLLFYGSNPLQAAYQGGWLCVQAPTRRTGLLDSGGNPGADDCSGNYAFDFNEHIRVAGDTSLVPGAVVHVQFWSRDPGASANTNRSDALRFTIAP